MIYLARLGLFLTCGYLGTVIALRGKDEFNLVIPYVRFVPHDVHVPLVVVDASALIDGRIVKVCESGFLGAALVIPRFVHLVKAVSQLSKRTRIQRTRSARIPNPISIYFKCKLIRPSLAVIKENPLRFPIVC